MKSFTTKIALQALIFIACQSSLQLQASWCGCGGTQSNVQLPSAQIQSPVEIERVQTFSNMTDRITIHPDNVNIRFHLNYSNGGEVIINGIQTNKKFYKFCKTYEPNSLSVHEYNQFHVVRSLITDTINPILQKVLDDEAQVQAELVETKRKLDNSCRQEGLLRRDLMAMKKQIDENSAEDSMLRKDLMHMRISIQGLECLRNQDSGYFNRCNGMIKDLGVQLARAKYNQEVMKTELQDIKFTATGSCDRDISCEDVVEHIKKYKKTIANMMLKHKNSEAKNHFMIDKLQQFQAKFNADADRLDAVIATQLDAHAERIYLIADQVKKLHSKK